MSTESLDYTSLGCVEGFDEVIDVRSPAEFAEDHIPGAINLPVLTNSQRAEVGTLHRARGEFEARKHGASLISANIAHHLERHFLQKPKTYRVLIYCWRGGQRSGSLATVLRAVGWRAITIRSGYKSFRKFVRESLEEAGRRTRPIILAGLTGSGKTALIRKMLAAGAPQALDLEGLANHRGSLLGDEVAVNDAAQPSQKNFETRLLFALHRLDPEKPTFIESESKRIGSVSIPQALWESMIRAPVVGLTVPVQERARFLVEDYQHFVSEPAQLLQKLPVLKQMHGSKTIEHWKNLAAEERWQELSEALLERHYDPSYRRCKNYAQPSLTIPMAQIEPSQLQSALDQLKHFAAQKQSPLTPPV